MKLFVIRMCRFIAVAGAVFICAMPMVLYADSYGEQISGDERVLSRISGKGIAEKHTQEVEVTVEADEVPDPVVIIIPTKVPTTAPTRTPTVTPTKAPTTVPTVAPTSVPSTVPTASPTSAPTTVPTVVPTAIPTTQPTGEPTKTPTTKPTKTPTPVPTIIRSTTTIIKPVVTTVPVYIPTITTVPAPYESKTPVPTAVILPGSGYTGGSSSSARAVAGEQKKPVRNDEVKEDNETAQELIIVQMQENQSRHEEFPAGYEMAEKEVEEAQNPASESILTESGNVTAEGEDASEETEEEESILTKLLRMLLRILIILLIVVVVAGVYLLGGYMGWWTIIWLPFFMKDDGDDEDGEAQESVMEGMEPVEVTEWSNEAETGFGETQEAGEDTEAEQEQDARQEQKNQTDQDFEEEGNNE